MHVVEVDGTSHAVAFRTCLRVLLKILQLLVGQPHPSGLGRFFVATPHLFHDAFFHEGRLRAVHNEAFADGPCPVRPVSVRRDDFAQCQTKPHRSTESGRSLQQANSK